MSIKNDLEMKAVGLFLYSPFDHKMEMKCMCEGTLKFQSLGGDFGRGDVVFKCDKCGKFLLIGYQFVTEKPNLFDRFDLVVTKYKPKDNLNKTMQK